MAKIELFIIAFPLFGLVKSNNISAVIGSLLIFAIYYLSKKKIEKSKIITYSLLLVTSVFTIG